jgi:hypothetical protein
LIKRFFWGPRAIRIVAHGDQRRHVEGIAQWFAFAANKRLALPLAGLPSDGREAGETGHLFALERAEAPLQERD